MSSKLNVIKNEEPWYAEGLRFECTGCGKCCTGAPGYTWVSSEEIKTMADYLKMPIDKFTRRYLRKVGKRHSLVEFTKNLRLRFPERK